MATFMEVLDTNIANVSLPHIAGNLSASQNESTWVLTSYLVANAVVLPVSGWLSNKIGRKRFYMSCVALFTIASLLCGMAPTLSSLVFFRVLQGIGGGGLAPSEQAILADTFPPAKRGMAMAVYGMAVVTAPAIGPTLGGFITDHFNWRWVFFINIPVGLLSLFLSNRVITDPPHLKLARERTGANDWVGLGLVAIGLGCLEVVLDKGQEEDWFHSPFILYFTIASAVSLVAFVLWELEQQHPILDVRLLRGSFAFANLLMLMMGINLYGAVVLLPQYTQVLLGYSAQQAGLVLSPGGLVVIVLLPFVGRWLAKGDARVLVSFGFVATGTALFYVASQLDMQVDFATLIELRMIQSVGLAFTFVPIQTLSYAGIPPQKFNQVSGMVNLSRNLGGDIGIAFVTTMIARRAQVHQAILSAHTTTYSPEYVARAAAIARAFQHAGSTSFEATKQATAAMYRLLIQQATELAYLDALRALALSAVLVAPLAWLTQRPTEAGPAGH